MTDAALPAMTDKQAEHELKTDPEVFQAVWSGAKTHEIRKDDRGFAVGDTLWLRETKYTGQQMRVRPEACPLVYTGRELRRTVSHILTGYGLSDHWCILSFAPESRSTEVGELTDEQIIKIAETLPDREWNAKHPGDKALRSWGQGYREDGDGRYAIPRVPDVCIQFARALLATQRSTEPAPSGTSTEAKDAAEQAVVEAARRWYETSWGKSDAAHELALAVLRLNSTGA